MDKLITLFKVILLAIVEGISEWLPISSSGHMLLIDEFIYLELSSAFKELFFIFIQLGAILAVILLFYKNITPILINNKKVIINHNVLKLWKKIIIACIPGAIVAILFDNFIETHLHTTLIISSMLVLYGIIFLFIDKIKIKNKDFITSIDTLTYKSSLLIGMFQILSIIPGTSRSGATIIGALLLGVSKSLAAEFSFYLAIPVMFGMSIIKLFKYGFIYTLEESILLLIGAAIAFLVSLVVIKFILQYIKKHDFKVFGIYRIILGSILLLYFF